MFIISIRLVSYIPQRLSTMEIGVEEANQTSKREERELKEEEEELKN